MSLRQLLLAAFAPAVWSVAAAAQTASSSSSANRTVSVRIYVSLSDSATRFFPVAGYRLFFYRTAADSVLVTTDSMGRITVPLIPGDYRLVSAQPVSWKGYDYSWNVPVLVRPGMPIVDLRAPEALLTSSPPVRAEPQQTGSPSSVAQPIPPFGPRPLETVRREGFWFNIGFGSGSLGCSDCGTRVTGLSGGLGIGGTINPHVRLGAFTSGWVKSEDGTTLNASVVVAGVHYYPSETSGFFLLGGLGIASIDVIASGLGHANESGTGVLLGLGWDLRIAKSVSFTPFWNGVGISISDGDANYGQIGVGLTIH